MDQKLGPTGEFPRGKLDKSDEGELAIGLTADKKTGTVIISFGKSITWIGLDIKGTEEFIELLKIKVTELRS